MAPGQNANQRERVMEDRIFSCADCGDVIGIYEPLIVVEERGPRQTSRAAEPALADRPDSHYHRACYPSMPAERPSPES
jgi:hypothetical protein